MIRYFIRRLLSSIVIVLALSVVIFFAGRALPGNVAAALVGQKGTHAEIAAVEHSLGLDKPLPLQYLIWLGKALHGDFGTSPITGLTNSSVVATQAPISFELAIFSLLLAIIIGIPLGVLTSGARSSGGDWSARIPFLVIFAIPGFVSGSLLLYVAANYLPVLYSPTYIPLTDDPGGNLAEMFLPAFSVGLPMSALIAQMTRSSMLEVLSQPYIASARTQGIPEWKIRYGYALKPALPPILTLIGLIFGLMIGGLFITEDIFSLPGLGRGVLGAISSRDFELLEVQALVLAVAFIAGNFLIDMVIPFIDRRIVSA